jgi:hypothetical protein
MSKSEHEARARDFVDSILKVNKQHGISETSRAIRYDAAVKAAARTPKRLGKKSAKTTRKSA